jgi:PAS domain S-box-containing protein
MPGKDLHKFYLSIVIPSIATIILFIISMFIFILPYFETNIMDKKKEMISELTNTAWSLLEEYDREVINQNLTKKEAQEMVASRIEQIRYGKENKDYFWIIDQQPRMIMHPYRPELIQTDLSNYEDPNGKKLFVEATSLVSQDGEGYIDYMWQWKDDSTRIVPKLSYVRGFSSWGWIIGTGIYLEDVQKEIRILKLRLLRISLMITAIITLILSFVIRQSLSIENQRKDAEAELLLSKQKYKSLVQASTEGTLMMLNQKIIFSNIKFSNLSGYESEKVLSLSFEDIFTADWGRIISSFEDTKRSVPLETQIKCANDVKKEVIISVSQIQYGGDIGYIIVVKEITQERQIEKETEHLAQELQTSLLLMNQSIKPLIHDVLKCTIDTSIHDAAALMTRKKSKIIFIHRKNEVIGVINDSDLKKRVIAEGLDTQRPVVEIMTSPVKSISEHALLYEAILKFKNTDISHLATRNENGSITGVISYEEITGMQQNSVSYLIKEIEISEDIEQLRKIHNRVPVLVNALLESGDKTQNITRIITSISDSIAYRIISLAIEDLGEPPCSFAFMVMGSEGRMEQTLSTDQDNAIIFDNMKQGQLEKARKYFEGLGKQISQNLHVVGYKLCEGEIMASNPKWVQPLSVWKDYFSEWINSSDPQSILDASIFFDFRFVYGKKVFVNKLRQHVNKALDGKSVFFYHLAQSVVKFKPPLSFTGKIISKNHSGDHLNIDIKKIIFPIVGFIRLYALNNKLDETNTLERLRQLHLQEIITKAMYDELVLSYNYLMHLRFRFQARSILDNLPPDNIIDINKLTQIEVTTLKKIFGEMNDLQTKLNFDFKGSI